MEQKLLELAVQYWQFTLVGVLVIVGLVANRFGSIADPKTQFEYKKMPLLRPLPIPTKGRGFWYALYIWLSTNRQWQLEDDWFFSINGQGYVIPAGSTFDGANFPPPINAWILPTGVMMIASIVHDYAYKHKCLTKANGIKTDSMSRKYYDELFRDINISVNGFKLLNWIGYAIMRVVGVYYWRQK